jgi:hypothetical protein
MASHLLRVVTFSTEYLFPTKHGFQPSPSGFTMQEPGNDVWMNADDANARLDPGTARVGSRLGRGLLLGLALGALAGAVIGAIAGATLGSGGATKFWTFFIAAFVACSALGTLIGSYSSLESPQPGQEPTDTERPVRDADGLTTEERAPRTAPPPTN